MCIDDTNNKAPDDLMDRCLIIKLQFAMSLLIVFMKNRPIIKVFPQNIIHFFGKPPC